MPGSGGGACGELHDGICRLGGGSVLWEGPQHRVTIDHPFAVGVYEVTFEEWDACVRAGGCRGHEPDDEGWGRGRRPAIGVSWDDAWAYADWLTDQTGQEYRVLSEAEWGVRGAGRDGDGAVLGRERATAVSVCERL